MQFKMSALGALFCLFFSTQVFAQEMEPVVNGPLLVEIPLDPRGTYLRTAPGDFPNAPSTFTLDLNQYGYSKIVQPGDQLLMIAIGAFSPGGTFPDTTERVIGVFGDAQGNFYTSPSLIQQDLPGTPFVVTLPSSLDGVPTDISEDFPISNVSPLSAIVPAGADRILFSVDDAFFADNSDPNGDNKIQVVIDFVVDLIVQDLFIAQVVPNPDFVQGPTSGVGDNAQDTSILSDGELDLVKDKSAIATVSGMAPGYSSGFFLVEFRISGPNLSSDIVINGIAEVAADRTFSSAIKIPTDIVGNFQIVASIIPDQGLPEADLTNNTSPVVNFKVHQTFPLDIGIIQMTGCDNLVIPDCPGSASFSQTQSFLAADFLQFLTRIFPVADSGQLTVGLTNSNFVTNVDFTPALAFTNSIDVYDQGLLEDIRRLAVTNSASLKRKSFAIVPDDYICFHNVTCRNGTTPLELADKETYGIVFPGENLNVGFVRASSREILAHELGHLLGQGLEAEEINILDPNGNPTTTVVGIDASSYIPPTPQDVSGGNLSDITFSGKIPIMSSPQDLNDLSRFWVSRNTYIKSFNTLLSPSIDPELYVFSGFLDTAGNLSGVKVEEFPSGNLTNSQLDGSFSVQTLDLNGNLLNSTTVSPRFEMFLTKRGSTQSPKVLSLDKIPVVVAVPKTPEVATIKVFDGERELFEEVIIESPVKISNLVKEIPLSAFKGKGWLRWYNRFKKQILIDIAKGAERLEDKGKNRAAIWSYKKVNKLVKRWVKPKYRVDGMIKKRKAVTSAVKEKINTLRQ